MHRFANHCNFSPHGGTGWDIGETDGEVSRLTNAVNLNYFGWTTDTSTRIPKSRACYEIID